MSTSDTITQFGQIFTRCPECGDLALDPRTDECLTCLCTCETYGHCEVCR